MKDLWSWIEKNRFTVILPVMGLILWVVAVGCEPATPSPFSGKLVNAEELKIDFLAWQNQQEVIMEKFKFAEADIAKQKAAWDEFTQVLLQLASGSVAGWPGLLQILLGGGILGVVSDNIRKNGVINGQKMSIKATAKSTVTT
ncbi:MAG TPA: hypothetical protein DC049_08025 [Spirochaetia bacterium]|nr:hypothetical protein [Spirochaetia bacterium]